MTKSETVTAEDIDRMVDEGQDMTAYIKMDTLRTPNIEDGVRKVSCAIPEWIIKEAEREAKHLAISRSAVINVWLAEKAKESMLTS